LEELYDLFESREKGASNQLKLFLADAREKYEIGIGEFVHKPGLSIMEFANPSMLKSAMKMSLFNSFSKHARKYFKSQELLQILEFPVLFLGAQPQDIPAMYSMMNYADLELGTWYPMGGFGKLPEAMLEIATSLGV